jgi:hypothetical protein
MKEREKFDRSIVKPWIPSLDTLTGACTLVLVYFVILSRFDITLLCTDTILTGGDSASWFQVLKTLKEEYLPRGRVFGYSLANFFGYMEGQHYFLLPFLFAAISGFFMPLTIALKIATVAGGLALPLTMFMAVSSISGKKRAGAIAASFALLFLFNESYTIFGGNWLSTFAGEFCFSWATALLPLLVSSIVCDLRDERSGIVSGLLLGLIGLCHFFVFMPAFFLPFFPIFGILPHVFSRKKGTHTHERRIVRRAAYTYLSAFLVMAFWLLPMAATRMWAQPISILWHFESLKDLARQTLAWIWMPSSVLFLYASIGSKRKHDPQTVTSALMLYGIYACAFLFFVAPGLGMPDIRFVPSALIFSSLGLAVLTDHFLESVAKGPSVPGRFWVSAAPIAAVLTIGLACSALAVAIGKNSPSWFGWNYSGYEAKTEWPFLKALEARYGSTIPKGRFLWEKQDQKDNKDFGSERGFESLYLFTGFPSGEGIHYGSSMMARATTYLQSTYSKNPVDPEPERIYSEISPGSWVDYFSLTRAQYIITHSPEITSLFSGHPSFSLDFRRGKFSVFRFIGFEGSYVEILSARNISIVKPKAGGFRADYYRYFKDNWGFDYPFVSSVFADRHIRDAVAKANPEGLPRPLMRPHPMPVAYNSVEYNSIEYDSYDEYRTLGLPKARIENSTSPPLPPKSVNHEYMDNFVIRFETDSPGEPHYIHSSYAPGWKSNQGERIYPISPGFMLIYPESKSVVIEYRRTFWEILGIALSGTLPFIVFLERSKKLAKKFPFRIISIVAFSIFCLLSVGLLAKSFTGYPALARDIGNARRLNLDREADRIKAESLIKKWVHIDALDTYDNRLIFDAFRIKARISEMRGDHATARSLLQILRDRYSGTRAMPTLPRE